MKRTIYSSIFFFLTLLAAHGQEQTNPNNGLPRSIDHSIWEDGAWKPEWHSDRVYGENGELQLEQINYVTGDLERVTYSQTPDRQVELIEKKVGSDWVPQVRYTYELDDRGNVTNYKTETFANGTWSTEDEWQYIFEYLNNLLMSKTVSSYDKQVGQVQPDYKYLYSYNSSQQLSSQITQNYWNGAFNNQSKTEYNYVDQILAFEEMYTWSQNNWRRVFRSTYAWKENNGSVLTRESWNEAEQKFSPVTRITLSKDFRGNLILYQLENWVNSAWVIFYGYKYLLSYDYFNLIERVIMNWVMSGPGVKSGGGDWVNQTKEVYSNFLNLGVEQLENRPQDLLLFPNPVSGQTITIAGLKGTGSMIVDIISLDGRLIRSLVIESCGELTTFSTGDLPDGTYMIRTKEPLSGIKKGIFVKSQNQSK
jgi:hypothetical protein